MKCQDIKYMLQNIFEVNLSEKTRRRGIVEKRAIYYYLCKKYASNFTTSHSAKLVGRDHATCIHGCKMIENAIAMDFRGYENIGKLLKVAEPRIHYKSFNERNTNNFSIKQKLDYYRNKYWELKLAV